MGLGELVSGDAPTPETAQLDPLTKRLIDDQYKKAMQPKDADYGNIENDLSKDSGLFQEKRYGLLSDPMDQAIKQKYSTKTAQGLDTIRQKVRLGMRDKQINTMKMASSALIAQQNVQNDTFAKMLQAHQIREAARSAALNSILGFGGAVAGYKMAQESDKPNENKKTNVKISSPQGNQFGRDSLNDAPGMNRSEKYGEDIKGIGDFDNYA